MNLGQMVAQVSSSLDEGRSGPVFYPRSEIVAAINEAQRFWCILTLCLERTATWTVPAATPFSHMLVTFSDWIAPLRMERSNGARIRPATLATLDALDAGWRDSEGDPVRYCCAGVDLVGIYHQPAGGDTLQATYARGPVDLVNDTDEPEIRDQFHAALVDYGKYRPRQVEGAQEFAKGMVYFEAFLTAAKACADAVRARNLGAGYDRVPMEFSVGDWSRLRKPPVVKVSKTSA